MLIHGPVEVERRKLTLIGLAAGLFVVAAGLLNVTNPLGGRTAGLISVTIDTPYVGQGVAKGTPVVMHGVKIGEITAISSLPTEGVRLNIDLQETPVAGLSDTAGFDFRPINYFGVTGVNLIAGTGGQALRDGSHISTEPKGNFTLQVLLYRLGDVSTDVLTPKLIDVVDRATRYTDALNPLIETALVVGNSVAEVQTVSSARLLTNATGLSVVFPSTVDALVNAGDNLIHNDENLNHWALMDATEDQWQHTIIPGLELVAERLFNDVGKLEASHVGDLLPVTDTVKAVTDVVPPLIRPEGFAHLLAEMRTRFEKMYGGTAEQRALQVRIVLDSLPGVAAPLGAIGAP